MPAISPEELTNSIYHNLRNLGLEALDVVNLRLDGVDESIEEPLTVLAELKIRGLIRHLGLSNIGPAQLKKAQTIADIVCVQNHYNVMHRDDDQLIDDLAEQGIAYVPFHPVGGDTPLQSSTLDAAAKSIGVSITQLALAWLLQRSPNFLLIPGTSSVAHLRENLNAARIQIPAEILASLSAIGGHKILILQKTQ